MAEVRWPVGVPASPRGEDDVELGFIVDDVAEELVGVYGFNNTPDSFFFEIELNAGPQGSRTFRVTLDPGDNLEKAVRIPAARRLPIVQVPDDKGGVKWVLPVERMVKERVFTDPVRHSPTVLSVTETQSASNSTTHNANRPATVDAGDLLIDWTIFAQPDAGTLNDPAGYTKVPGTQGENDDGADFVNGSVWAREADGSEDGGTANFSTSGSCAFINQCHRIQAGTWSGDINDIDAATLITGTSTNPDVGTITSGLGVGDHLYMVFVGINNDSVASSGPSGYTGTSEDMNSTNDAHARSAYLVVAATDNTNPGAFTIDGGFWIAVGIVVPETVVAADPSHGWVMDNGTIDLPYQHDALPVFNPNDVEPQIIDASAAARVTPRAAATGKVVRPATARAYIPARAQAPGVVIRKSSARVVAAARASASGVTIRKASARAVAPVRASAVVELFVVGRPAARAAARATVTARLIKTGTASARAAVRESATGRRVLSAVARDSAPAKAQATGRVVRNAVARAVSPTWATVQADVLRDATAAARAAIRASGSATVRHPASARAAAAARIAVTGTVVRASSAQARAATRITVNATILSAPLRAKGWATPRAAVQAKVIVEATAAARCAPRAAVQSSVVHEATARASAAVTSHASGRRVAEASARAAATFRVGATARLLIDAAARGDAAAVAQAHAALLMGASAQAWMIARITVRLQSAGQVWYRVDPVDADPAGPAHATGGPAHTRAGPGHTSGGPAFTRMTGRDRPPLWN